MKTYLIAAAALLAFGCGNSDAGISNNAVPPVNTAPANTPQVTAPPENYSAASNANASVKTPGIPTAEEINKPFKPRATPTPGIPNDEKMRKLMGRPEVNVNVSATKTGRKLGAKTQ